MTGLDPETFLTYEIGVKKRLKHFSSEFAFYYTDIEDMIIRTPTGSIIGDEREVTKRNAGGGFIRGVELSLRAPLGPDWKTWAIFSWMEGDVDTYPTSDPVAVRETIDRLMPPSAQAGIGWRPPTGRFWAEGVVRWADDADKLSTRDRSSRDDRISGSRVSGDVARNRSTSK